MKIAAKKMEKRSASGGGRGGSFFARSRSNPAPAQLSANPPRGPGKKDHKQVDMTMVPVAMKKSRSIKVRFGLSKRQGKMQEKKIDLATTVQDSSALPPIDKNSNQSAPSKSKEDVTATESIITEIVDGISKSQASSDSDLSNVSSLTETASKYVPLKERLKQRELKSAKKHNREMGDGTRKNLLPEMDRMCLPIERKIPCAHEGDIYSFEMDSYDELLIHEEKRTLKEKESSNNKAETSMWPQAGALLPSDTLCTPMETFHQLLTTIGASVCAPDDRTVKSDPVRANFNFNKGFHQTGNTNQNGSHGIVPAAHSWPLANQEANTAEPLVLVGPMAKAAAKQQALKEARAQVAEELQTVKTNAQMKINTLAEELKKMEVSKESQCSELKSHIARYQVKLQAAKKKQVRKSNAQDQQDDSVLEAEIEAEGAMRAKEHAELKNLLLAEKMEQLAQELSLEQQASQKTINAQNNEMNRMVLVVEGLKKDIERERKLAEEALNEKDQMESDLQNKVDMLSHEIDVVRKKKYSTVRIAHSTSAESTIYSDVEVELEDSEDEESLQEDFVPTSSVGSKAGWFHKMMSGDTSNADDETLSTYDNSVVSGDSGRQKTRLLKTKRWVPGRVRSSTASLSLASVTENNSIEEDGGEDSYDIADDEAAEVVGYSASYSEPDDGTFVTSATENIHSANDIPQKNTSSDSETDCSSSSEAETFQTMESKESNGENVVFKNWFLRQ